MQNYKVSLINWGEGFTLVGNQYPITIDNKTYRIDILLFNVEYNCYIVVELKTRELRKEDKAQVEFYMNAVDVTLKRKHHSKTIGIIITKEQDRYVANFVGHHNIISLTYYLVKS